MKYVLIAVVLAVMCVALCSGCVNLSRGEKEDLRVIRDAGISQTDQSIKSSVGAGALNILPGFGNFYLAIGSDESEQYVVGFLNLLTWPWSILWGVPQAAIDANTMNKRETIYYYQKTDKGRAELLVVMAKQHGMPPIREPAQIAPAITENPPEPQPQPQPVQSAEPVSQPEKE